MSAPPDPGSDAARIELVRGSPTGGELAAAVIAIELMLAENAEVAEAAGVSISRWQRVALLEATAPHDSGGAWGVTSILQSG